MSSSGAGGSTWQELEATDHGNKPASEAAGHHHWKQNTHLPSRGADGINIYDRRSKRKTTVNEELGLEKVCYEFVVETLTQILPDH